MCKPEQHSASHRIFCQRRSRKAVQAQPLWSRWGSLWEPGVCDCAMDSRSIIGGGGRLLSPLSSLLGVYELERRHTLIQRTFLSYTSFCLYVLLHLELTRSCHFLRIRIQSTSINILNLHGAFGKQEGGDRQPRKSTFR